ncbi:MAG: protein-export chaperone SecB [Hyphomicrobiaceae bacterium]
MPDQAKPSMDAAGQPQPNIRIAGQYIKDLSFENPNVGKMLEAPVENPQLQIEVNVNARQAAAGMFESVINFTANATSTAGPLYKLELEYGGMFKIEHMPPQAMEPFLLINAPSLLFPFVRRLLADITREGGFPPLLLDPIDFASLYMKRKQTAQPANGNGAVA